MNTFTSRFRSSPARLFLLALIPLLSAQTHAQTDELINLFFSPVPVAMADNIVLNAGGSSAEDRDSAENAIPGLLDEVQQMQTADPENPELINSMLALALAYQTLDRHEEALELFNEITDLSAELNGENSVQLIPIIEQSILSHLLLGQLDEITEKEERVYAIYEQNYAPDSVEMYNALINLTDWYTAAYLKQAYLTQGTEYRRRFTSTQRTERQLGLEGDFQGIGDGSVRESGINDVIDGRLRQSDVLYSNYQQAYSSNTTLNIVVEVARRIARLAYHAEQEMDYERENTITDPSYNGSRAQALRNSEQRRNESYDTGRRALQYIVELLRSAQGIGPQQLTLALLDLADWDLAYGRNESASELYREAYQVLIDQGYPVATIDAALTPGIPATMPRIAAYPATLQTAGGQGLSGNPNYVGYIDVSYTLDDQGNATSISVLSSSEGTLPRIPQILVSQLEITKYRPLLRGGELVAQGPVSMRYYYSY